MSEYDLAEDVAVNVLALGWPTTWPNTHGAPTQNHLRLAIIPVPTESIGLRTLDRASGIIQITVAVRAGTGERDARQMADTVLAAFPRNTAFASCRIDVAGWISPPIVDDDWYLLPVSIPYTALR